MRVSIIEYYPDSVLGEIVCSVTKLPHSHTEILIDDWLCGTGTKEAPFGYSMVQCGYDFENHAGRQGRKYDIVSLDIPYEKKFAMLDFWRKKLTWKYSVLRALTFPIHVWMLPFYRKYYERTGKVFAPNMTGILMKAYVCSEAVDLCLREGGYDYFPWLSERVVYPGMFWKYKGGRT